MPNCWVEEPVLLTRARQAAGPLGAEVLMLSVGPPTPWTAVPPPQTTVPAGQETCPPESSELTGAGISGPRTIL